MKLFKSNFTLGLIGAAVVTLTACGGGGGGSAGGTANSVTGVAATGLAIVNGSVTLKCVTGTTSAIATGTDGSFSIDVSSVTLPCVARVDYMDSTTHALKKLHSLVSTTGNVNITPVTDLLVAKLSNGPAAAAFDGFDADKVKSYTKDQVSAATATVKTYLHDTLGVDTNKLPDDVIGTKLVAATSSTTGNDFDKVLDDLKSKLESNKINQEGAEHDVTFGPLAPAASAPTPAASAPTAAASSPTATSTASAVNGKALYASNSVTSCAGCHGTTPSVNKVLNGANNPTRILSAISGNTGGMNMYSGKFTTQNLADIAAYLATPSI